MRTGRALKARCPRGCRCEFYHLMRLDKQTCDWHNKKCDSLYVTQDISKEACQAAGNAVALIRGTHSRVGAALTLWVLGYPDQALARCHDALVLAHELLHPFSLAYAQYW